MMPGIDGLELYRLVRGEEQDEYAYFNILTSLGNRDHLLMGLEAGADDYLSKPLAHQNRELERLNRKLFEQSRDDPLTH